MGEPDENATRNWAVQHEGDAGAFKEACRRIQSLALAYWVELKFPARYGWIELKYSCR